MLECGQSRPTTRSSRWIISARPPTFVAFCSQPDALPKSYVRYLVNSLRETFDLPGVPIRLHLRKGANPYDT